MNEEHEVWKEIQGHQETYLVSNLGNIKTKQRKGFNGSIIKSHEIKKHLNSTGYYRVHINLGDGSKSYFLHRIVADLFVPNQDGKPDVAFKDGNVLNCRADNLEWRTRSETIAYQYTHGSREVTRMFGEEHGMHKLTNDDVSYIRRNYICGDREYGQSAMARLFNVSPRAIFQIVHNYTWKGIE